MEKVRILYESEPGRDGKCNANIKGSPLYVLVGVAVMVNYTSRVVAKKIGADKREVAQKIFDSVMNEMLIEEEKSNGKDN